MAKILEKKGVASSSHKEEGAEGMVDEEVPIDDRRELALVLEVEIPEEELAGTEWMLALGAKSSQTRLKEVCRDKGLKEHGSEIQTLQRIINHMCLERSQKQKKEKKEKKAKKEKNKQS